MRDIFHKFDEIAVSKLPTKFGTFKIYVFKEGEKEHVGLVYGQVSGDEPVPLRIHSECLTGDSLFSLRCDCGAQLQEAMRVITINCKGIILYLRQEGRGIGLLNKIKAYGLQDQGKDTVEANVELGFKSDEREFEICQTILAYLGVGRVDVLTNNPAKIESLKRNGIHVANRITLIVGMNGYNQKYLKTKAEKMGHMINHP